MSQSGWSSVEVSTELTLGLGPNNHEKITKRGEASPPAKFQCVNVQSSQPRMKCKRHAAEDNQRAIAQQAKDLEACQRKVREREQCHTLMEKEHKQLQDTIKYYRDIDQERHNTFEQMQNQLVLLDETYEKIHELTEVKEKLHETIVAQHKEIENLRQTILQQQKEQGEMKVLRKHLLRQQKENAKQIRNANETIMAYAAAARILAKRFKKPNLLTSAEHSDAASLLRELLTVICPDCRSMFTFCPHCYGSVYLAAGPTVCSHCKRPYSTTTDGGESSKVTEVVVIDD